MLRRFATVLLVSTLALSACGSDADEGSSAPDPAEDKATVKAAVAAFDAQAKREGFAVDDSDGEDEGDSGDLEFTSAECKRFAEVFGGAEEDDLPGQTADASTKSFTRGELGLDGESQETLEGGAAMVGDAEDLDEVFQALADERLEPCMGEALTKEFTASADEEEEEVTLGKLVVESRDLDALGDEAVDLHITASLGASGIDFPFVMDFALARRGRSAAFVVVSVIGGERPDASVDGYLRTLLGVKSSAA